MNGKSVRMSPAKTSCISTRLWNEAERGWQRADPPGLGAHVVEHLTLRGLGPAHGPPLGGLAGNPQRFGRPFGQTGGGVLNQAERLADLLPPDPQPGQRVAGGMRAWRASTPSQP